MSADIKLQAAFYVQNISSYVTLKSPQSGNTYPCPLPLYTHESLLSFAIVLQTPCLPVAVICHESISSSAGQWYNAYNSPIEDIKFVNPISAPPSDE